MMLSVLHHGQATVNRPAVVLEATTDVFTAGPAFLRPSELPPSAVPKPVRYMPGWYADFSSWGSQTKPIREDPREAVPPPMARRGSLPVKCCRCGDCDGCAQRLTQSRAGMACDRSRDARMREVFGARFP